MTTSPLRPAAPAKPIDAGKLALVMAYCADAEKLLLQDRFHEARKVVQQALRLAPNHAAAVHVLGVIEMESGNLEEAARLIKRTTELEPNIHDPFYGSSGVGLPTLTLAAMQERPRPPGLPRRASALLALKPDFIQRIGPCVILQLRRRRGRCWA